MLSELEENRLVSEKGIRFAPTAEDFYSYSSRFHRFLSVFLHVSFEDAEEAIQRVAKHLYAEKAIATFDGSKNFQAWIFTALRNAARDVQRQRMHSTWITGTEIFSLESCDESRDTDVKTALEQMLDEERKSVAIRAAYQLGEAYGKTLELRLQGKSNKEIAHESGEVLDTVRWRVQHTIENIRHFPMVKKYMIEAA